MKKHFAWKKHLTGCMQSTNYCCLATVDKKGVWANPVFFAWDGGFNLYFISQMHARHMQNLKQNPNVSVAIYNTEQKGDVAGIQLRGKANFIENKKGIMRAFEIYYGRAGKTPDSQSYIDNPAWFFVKIVPEDIYYFDSRFFKEERQEVPRSIYQKAFAPKGKEKG